MSHQALQKVEVRSDEERKESKSYKLCWSKVTAALRTKRQYDNIPYRLSSRTSFSSSLRSSPSQDYEVQNASFGPVNSDGPVEVRGVFDGTEKSSDVTVSEDGLLFRSIASSNQHALVDIGCQSGKCAWEFKLVEDSEYDECSAFGVANKPITSSSYESSPNMWVRRSYNGQLYHGSSAGYDCMDKLHPGDVVRIEVDMDKKTLSFKKNGEDEGAAFIDLVGEVFPIVCTYRSGIEVQLLKTEVWGGSSSSESSSGTSAVSSFDVNKHTLATNVLKLRCYDNLGTVSGCR